ncbi:MAG: universal stress protein [Rhizomicrobium sp.]
MNPPSKPPQARPEREAGRSFHDSSRPMGEEILKQAGQGTAPTEENFHTRVWQATRQSAVDRSGVGERAKVIGVLRKAEEFMSTANPPPDSDADVRRALELAGGRLGLTYREYRCYVDADPELVELERRVIVDARQRWGAAVVAAPVVAPPEETRPEALAVALFARLFVPVDYTLESHRAVQVALELRRTYGSALCLFHAAQSTGSDDWIAGIGSPAVGGDWVMQAKARLRRFLDHVAPDAGPEVEMSSKVGLPLVTLGSAAHEWGATLVVAAASLHASILRSPAEKLLRAMRLPSLIIPFEARR